MKIRWKPEYPEKTPDRELQLMELTRKPCIRGIKACSAAKQLFHVEQTCGLSRELAHIQGDISESERA